MLEDIGDVMEGMETSWKALKVLYRRMGRCEAVGMGC